MDDFNSSELFKKIDMMFDIDDAGDKHEMSNVSLTIGVVVDTDDPLEMGRLRVFCPAYNDNPKKLQHLPWTAYVMPFGGAINNSCFTRGTGGDTSTSNGASHYGMWAIPEQGAAVIVGCVDGDTRRRFWIGCLPSQQETHTMFTGRFKWNGGNGTPDGPLTSTGDKLQPLYDNLTAAFVDRTSAEWKTRGADYQGMAVNADVGELPNTTKTNYLDDQYKQISQAENDEWVKSILGAHGYDWTSFKNLGAFKSSKVFGFSTPGGHSLHMDDRPFNSRIKLRTTAGHQILLDDTNERIYISTNKGNCFIEMDSNGNMDVYAKRRLSVHSEKDINFSTDETFRVKAKKGIFMYAGDTQGQSPLPEVPADGQIRFHATNDMHVFSEQNIRMKSGSNLYVEIAQNIDMLASQNIDIKSNNINVKVGQNWNQECGSAFGVKAATIGLVATSSIIASVSSTNFKVDATNIISDASANVFFKAPGVQGSIISINTTFTTKLDTPGGPLQPDPAPSITPPTITVTEPDASQTKIAPWTNRVPMHEPWPRVMKQDSGESVNSINTGSNKNVDWIDQYDNTTSPAGRQPIGRVEGNDTIERNQFWRR